MPCIKWNSHFLCICTHSLLDQGLNIWIWCDVERLKQEIKLRWIWVISSPVGHSCHQWIEILYIQSIWNAWFTQVYQTVGGMRSNVIKCFLTNGLFIMADGEKSRTTQTFITVYWTQFLYLCTSVSVLSPSNFEKAEVSVYSSQLRETVSKRKTKLTYDLNFCKWIRANVFVQSAAFWNYIYSLSFLHCDIVFLIEFVHVMGLWDKHMITSHVMYKKNPAHVAAWGLADQI